MIMCNLSILACVIDFLIGGQHNVFFKQEAVFSSFITDVLFDDSLLTRTILYPETGVTQFDFEETVKNPLHGVILDMS